MQFATWQDDRRYEGVLVGTLQAPSLGHIEIALLRARKNHSCSFVGHR